ncbi:universal stress protein [Jhaorihella thermophila]
MLRVAEEAGSDLIVVGGRTTRSCATIFWGRMRREIARHASCSVYVVR